ncbi:dihydrofolate reductase [Deinococcus cavernae]|uniref:Dihydrofolate reductase n=1 Tax=Deinococcus cavernae TaxID=2320857 RepID=A0A418V8N8_9DEIO|nr:dihydrofolate reductase [Deinococcus cavernae]RJF72475.1 dihydrofolate reductase [Deinococcus cavernae]
MPTPETAGPELIAIYAMTENRVIGKDGGMPWHLPADFAHFKRLSVGKPNIMGRKVWESLGGQALKNRLNIVLTRNRDFQAQGVVAVHSPEEALKAAGEASEIAIIGGAEIYKLYADQLTRREETIIHTALEGDTFMPELPGEWELVSETFRPADDKNKYDLTFRTLVRRTK